MSFTRFSIDMSSVESWDTFHTVFKAALGFPDFYGRNMNAWIDCLTSVDTPDDGLTTVHVPIGGVMVLELLGARALASRCPEIFAALIECTAFVNYRRIDVGCDPVLCLSFFE